MINKLVVAVDATAAAVAAATITYRRMYIYEYSAYSCRSAAVLCIVCVKLYARATAASAFRRPFRHHQNRVAVAAAAAATANAASLRAGGVVQNVIFDFAAFGFNKLHCHQQFR